MTTFITVLVILAFIAVLFGFYQMQKKHLKFSTRVFSALGVGIVLGAIIQFAFGTDSKITTQSMEWIGIVGNGYVAFLQMLVIPLVFVSIVGAFTKMKESNKLGKISFNVLATLLGTTAVAALVGIGNNLSVWSSRGKIHARCCRNVKNCRVSDASRCDSRFDDSTTNRFIYS